MISYKDSGIEWIGEIPGNWKIDKIKYLSNLYGRIGWQGLTSEEYIDEGPFLVTGVDFCKGEIDWSSCVHISEKRWEQADKIQLKNNDLLITKDGTVGKVAVVDNLDGKASLNSGVLLIDLNDKNSKKYLYWVLSSDVFWTWFNYKNSGNSTILHLYQKDFNEFIYAMPSLIEQNKIAEFLDKKCAEIDSLTSKIEKQIGLLKDYKKSLITETVTKGLDKNVPMKDSGIAWIDEIPEHWEVSKIKYIFSVFSGSTPDTNNIEYWGEDIEWITPADMDDTGEIYGGERKITLRGYMACGTNLLPKGSIVISNRAPIGKINYSMNQLCTNQGCKGLVRNGDNKYFYYLMLNSIERILLLGRGTTFLELSTNDLNNLNIVVPSEYEQLQIADFLDKKCSEIDSIISKKEKQLDLMKEHRKSLIYEYVTGKKRVGGVDYGN